MVCDHSVARGLPARAFTTEIIVGTWNRAWLLCLWTALSLFRCWLAIVRAPYVLSVSFRPQPGPASPWRRVFMLILVKGKCCRLDVCFCAHPHVTFDLCVFSGCERPSACLPSSYQVPRQLTALLPTRNLLLKLYFIQRKSGKKLALFVSCVCEHNGR